MNYFITLNIQSDKDYKKMIRVLEKAGFIVVGIDGVTEWKDSSISRKSYKNACNALTQHKKDLRF